MTSTPRGATPTLSSRHEAMKKRGMDLPSAKKKNCRRPRDFEAQTTPDQHRTAPRAWRSRRATGSGDIGLRRFPLEIERVEVLLQPVVGGDPRVNGAAQAFGLWPGHRPRTSSPFQGRARSCAASWQTRKT